MDEDDIKTELRELRSICQAQYAALKVLMHYAPQEARNAVAQIGQGVDDHTLALPIPDAQRDFFLQRIRELTEPKPSR